MLNHILLGFGISFVGSLPLGVLNLTAIEVAVSKRFYQVLLFALGVILIEYGQAYIGIRFSDYMLSNPTVNQIIQIGVIPLFLSVGIAYLITGYKKRKASKIGARKLKVAERKIPPFVKGIMLSIINPLAIPYWLAVTTSLNAAGQLNYGFIHAFLCGVVMGTFTALTLYGSVGEALETKLKKYEKYFNSVIGVMLISLAIIQAYKLIG
ncbi:MAG: threonine/homoserine/homoserine lactone efflux protein [Maribacter sp.]|jgi:threonine/homoserine/homoserine lactone efflux protein